MSEAKATVGRSEFVDYMAFCHIQDEEKIKTIKDVQKKGAQIVVSIPFDNL